jgi:hypothetical protein
MSERALTAAVVAELNKNLVHLALLWEGVFDGGAVRLWSGIGPRTWSGSVFTGVGTLAGIDHIEENVGEVKASGIGFKLSGIRTDMISLIRNERFQGRPATLWLAFLDDNDNIIPDPVKLNRWRMDYPVMEEGATEAVITVFAETPLIDLERPRIGRRTDEDQKKRFPGDRFFEGVTALQNKQITFKV